MPRLPLQKVLTCHIGTWHDMTRERDTYATDTWGFTYHVPLKGGDV